MANRLIQILTATNIAAGATTVLTHAISLNGTPHIPDIIARDNDVFSIGAVTSTTVSVTNTSGAVATGNFYLRYDHTITRVFGTNGTTLTQLSPAPFIIGGSAASGVAGGDSNCLVFQPGGTETGPIVFDDWADLMTQLDALRAAAGGGCYSVEIDDSLAAATIPAGGPYDFTDTDLKGAGNGATVTIAEGASFTALRSFDRLIVVFVGTGASPITDVVNGDVFWVRDTVLSTTTAATVGLIAYTVIGAGAVTMWLTEGAAIGGAQTGRVIEAAGAHTLTIVLDSSSSIAVPATVEGAAATTLTQAGPAGIKFLLNTSFTNWAGTISTPTLQGPMSLLPNPYQAAAAAAFVTALHGQWIRLTTTAGNISQALPAIANATAGASAPGTPVIVTNYGTANLVTATPAGGDTIIGSAIIPAGGTTMFISDGGSAWTAVNAPAWERYQPAEQWAQNDVAAGQTNVDLEALVSTLFDTWKAPRAGSIVGLTTRLSEAVTAETLTITVTINGTEGTLSIAHTAGANPSGGIATQAPGTADNYAAGDLLGVSITTTGGFTPVTTDIEAALQVAEVL